MSAKNIVRQEDIINDKFAKTFNHNHSTFVDWPPQRTPQHIKAAVTVNNEKIITFGFG